VPVALSVKGEQRRCELSSYKNSPNPSLRSSVAVGLGAVLWRRLDAHEACVAERARGSAFRLVVPVPSTRDRADHLQPGILREIIKPASDRYVDLRPPTPGILPNRVTHTTIASFVSSRLSGEPVMLVDDRRTSGSRAQIAATALKIAGSGPVAAVSLGRHFDGAPSGEQCRQAAGSYYRSARAQGWSSAKCCLCHQP